MSFFFDKLIPKFFVYVFISTPFNIRPLCFQNNTVWCISTIENDNIRMLILIIWKLYGKFLISEWLCGRAVLCHDAYAPWATVVLAHVSITNPECFYVTVFSCRFGWNAVTFLLISHQCFMWMVRSEEETVRKTLWCFLFFFVPTEIYLL